MEIETSISHMSNNESGETASLASRGQNNSIKKKKLSQVAEVSNEKKEKKSLEKLRSLPPTTPRAVSRKGSAPFPYPCPVVSSGFPVLSRSTSSPSAFPDQKSVALTPRATSVAVSSFPFTSPPFL